MRYQRHTQPKLGALLASQSPNIATDHPSFVKMSMGRLEAWQPAFFASLVAAAQDTLDRLKLPALPPLLQDARRQQLADLAGEEAELSIREQEQNYYLAVSVVAMGFSGAAAMLHVPLLTLVSVSMLSYLYIPVLENMYRQVLASTIVLSGKIHIQVERAGSATTAAQIGNILNQTAAFKEKIETNSITLTKRFLPLTIALSLVSLPFVGINRTLALLESSFGYNLHMSGPMSLLNLLQIAAQQGILVKDGAALEQLPAIDTVVFDKTGTLTLEQPHVGVVHTYNSVSEDTVLTWAAAAEYRQTHPIARAILHAAHEQDLTLPPIDDTYYKVGYGLQVLLDGRTIRVGSTRFMEMEQVVFPDAVYQLQAACHNQGYGRNDGKRLGDLGRRTIYGYAFLTPTKAQCEEALQHLNVLLNKLPEEQDRQEQAENYCMKSGSRRGDQLGGMRLETLKRLKFEVERDLNRMDSIEALRKAAQTYLRYTPDSFPYVGHDGLTTARHRQLVDEHLEALEEFGALPDSNDEASILHNLTEDERDLFFDLQRRYWKVVNQPKYFPLSFSRADGVVQKRDIGLLYDPDTRRYLLLVYVLHPDSRHKRPLSVRG
jgi:hypothetical protein